LVCFAGTEVFWSERKKLSGKSSAVATLPGLTQLHNKHFTRWLAEIRSGRAQLNFEASP